MVILNDVDIREALNAGAMDIDPFSEDQLTPNGYDLAIAEILLPGTGDSMTDGRASVPPMTRFMVSTLERVRLGPDMTAQLWLRTSWARRGVLASFGRVDAGFDGTLTFGAFNSSASPMEVPIGETFAQMVVERMSASAEALYAQRSGSYQDQRGVTMAVERDAPPNAPELKAPCLDHGCHECCVKTEMPLSGRDVERLAARGHDPVAFSRTDAGVTLLLNVEGRCFFLDDEGLCTVYADRPDGCRLYPLTLDEDLDDFALDELCPHRGEVGHTEAHEAALLDLLDRIGKAKRNP